jgi:predicted negative regulator of RcsB-dependent stress response
VSDLPSRGSVFFIPNVQAMAAQSIASRPKRRPQTEPDDVVLARALEFSEWARKNVMLISVLGVAVVVLVGGFFWYRTDQARRLENAAVAFLQVEQSMFVGDDAMAQRDLQLFIQQHGGTPYAEEARVMLGQVHLEGGRPQEAMEVLRPVADRLDRSPVGVQAALLLAAAQEAAGQPAAADETYLRVADRAEMEYRRQEALIGAALLREQAGNHAGAAEIYRRLVATAEPGTPDRLMFEMRLAEAEARVVHQQ